MKKTEVVYAPLTACPDCGGMRCALVTTIGAHPDGENAALVITTLVNIAAEILSAMDPSHDAESAEVVKAMFLDEMADMRGMPRAEGESLH